MRPNGVSDTLASLKCCLPNGIPIIVMHSITPRNTWVNAIHISPITIHNIFMNSVKHPSDDSVCTVSFPNGEIAIADSLNTCIPNGIPMIVQHKRSPASKYSMAINIPPNINQIKFPAKFIIIVSKIKKLHEDMNIFLENSIFV